MIGTIQPTSKTSLKLQCLTIAKGDVKTAQELYDYLAAGLETLPDFDPVKPTFLETTKNTADGILQWVRENKETLGEGIDFVKGLISKRNGGTATPKTPLPPIN